MTRQLAQFFGAFSLFPQFSDDLTEMKITFESYFSFWPLIMIALLMLGLLLYQFFSLRRKVSTGWTVTLTSLRFLALFMLLIFFLNPTLLMQKKHKIPSSLALLLDSSESMGLSNSSTEKGSRLEKGKDFLLNERYGLLHHLSEKYNLHLYQFDEGVKAILPKDVSAVTPSGQKTDIVGALNQVQNEFLGRPLAGMILLSDGRESDDKGKREGFLGQFKVPVVSVSLGNFKEYKDIELSELHKPDFAFLHNPVNIDVIVKGYGYKGIDIPLIFKRGSTVLSTKFLKVNREEFEEKITFEYTPRELGNHTLSLSTPLQVGEEISTNNSLNFTLQVVRDKIRVLLVCGTPTWNYRFLRTALKSDPSIDLISFVILRTPMDIVDVPENQLSLIPFPANRLFSEELENFDLLIFDNFSYRFYFPLSYLENIKTFVRNGGAFAMFGGFQSFDRGGYSSTPIADILPVELAGNTQGYSSEHLAIKLTKEGKTHPITQLAYDAQENEKIWGKLPPLDGFNPTLKARSEAVVLGIHPSTRNQYGNLPILAAMKYEKGRTVSVMTDFIWKWNFEMVGQGEGNQAYLRLIRQMTRWLINDPKLKQVQILASGEEYELGKEVKLKIEAFQNDYAPAKDAILSLSVKGSDGREITLEYVPSDKPGAFVASFRPLKEGFYEVKAEARLNSESLGTDEAVFKVATTSVELKNGAPDEHFLKEVAEATGGKSLSFSQLPSLNLKTLDTLFKDLSRYRVVEERHLELWSRWETFLLFLLLLSAEWSIRRMRGLI
ncbi:MAG: hypothetical protein HY731_13415 [Candidatus Tectomicrobia bacterium]|nr:hypothetical protein [Candidatus Tectomicrobia bacterium]